MCPCISASPGIRYLPRPSTRMAPSGIFADFAGPTAVMRSPVTTTVWPGSRASFVMGTTVTFSNATLRGVCAPAPSDASATIAATERPQLDSDIEFLPVPRSLELLNCTSPRPGRLRRSRAALDVGADDRVEVLILREFQGAGAGRVERARPRVDQLRDARISLEADARHGLRTGDPFERIHHLADRDRQSGQADGPVGAEPFGRQIVRVDEAAHRGCRRDDPHPCRAIDRAD